MTRFLPTALRVKRAEKLKKQKNGALLFFCLFMVKKFKQKNGALVVFCLFMVKINRRTVRWLFLFICGEEAQTEERCVGCFCQE